ncbi:MAG: hypothetical protein SFX18_08155 [Pirellulales bacterium]|nr:hypothetical protein [Pirellulales bacterium]
MSEQRTRVHEIAWLEVFPWLRLADCLRMSLRFGALLLGTFGFLAMLAGWQLIARFFASSENPATEALIRQLTIWPGEAKLAPDASLLPMLSAILDFPVRILAPIQTLFNPAVSLGTWFFALLCGLWALLVWSLFGAALTRMAALSLTVGVKVGPLTALRYGMQRWTAYFGGPVLPLLSGVFFAAILFLPSLITRLDFGAAIVGILWPLLLGVGLILSLVLLGLLFGWPLMWPVISVEGTEPFDAISRAYSYTYHRFLRYLFFAGVALLLGSVGLLIVNLFVESTISLAEWSLSWGAGRERLGELANPATATNRTMLGFAAWSIQGWNWLVRLVMGGFMASYFWTSSTLIYLLLRQAEDGAEIEEIYIEDQGNEFGLPPLTTDAAGVPAVGDQPPTP